MNIQASLIAVLAAAVLLACGHDHESDQGHEHPTPARGADKAAVEQTPAGNETQAFYGEEEPVLIEAAPESDHGHSHDQEGDHSHEEDKHSHEEDEHSHEEGEHSHDDHRHDHGDSTAPHDH